MTADLKLKRAHAEDALRASEARYRFRTRTANANTVFSASVSLSRAERMN